MLDSKNYYYWLFPLFIDGVSIMTSFFQLKKWPKNILIAAGIYNIIWGGSVVLFPALIFNLLAITPPSYPAIWQCVGMIVGVYGVGYFIAAFDPAKHWVIVLVGFLGKIFGPIGFVGQVINGVFPIEFGYVILFNDLIWWIPFFIILKYVKSF